MASKGISSRPTAIDLFTGAGGLSLGLEQAGFEVVGAVEYDPVHLATHEFNFPRSKSICASVTDLTGEQILEAVGHDQIDLIAGGPPCQGFSMIGHRALEDDRNRLLFEFFRLVGEIRPTYFVMENVPGMAIGQHAGLLNEFVSRMWRELNYRCNPVQMLTATNFGVPQSRKRLFLVGAIDGAQLPELVSQRTRPIIARQNQTFEFDFPATPTVNDAIGDLPNADDFDELLGSDSVAVDYSPCSTYSKLLHGVTRAPDDFSAPRVWDAATLTSSLRTIHTPLSVSRFASTEVGKTETISRFLRLDPGGYCNTLRAGTDSKRGAHTSPRPIHPFHPRVITVREAARLHSFPDWFRLHTTKWHGFRQVGNAVAPNVGRAVGSTIINAIGFRPNAIKRPLKLGDCRLLELNMSEAADYYNVSREVIGSRTRRTSEMAS